MDYHIRKAVIDDKSSLEMLIARSARVLGAQDYSPEQIEGALRGAFGVDTDLIRDGTYFVAMSGAALVGCGGWSKRKTLFGGDQHTTRDAGLLDPLHDSARIRAFFVHPAWTRKGIAKAILQRCESEAQAYGFRSAELMSTLPGVKFYTAQGYHGSEPVHHQLTPTLTIEFIPMKKTFR